MENEGLKNITNPNIIVQLKDVSKSFGKNTVIKDFSLDIYEGEFITLLGPSGCGKTTVLRLISGLEMVTKGKVYIENKDVTNIDATKREVNTIFQNFALFPHMTVYDNIAFGLRMKHVPEEEIKKRVRSAIKLVNLEKLDGRYPSELSGGQQQRVAIARGIVTKPKVLLLDESLCSLDLKLKRKMQIELKKIQQKLGITFVYVTHDQNEAITMSDRIVIINKGAIEQIGTPKDVYMTPVNVFTADFIGESNIYDGNVIKVNGEFCWVVLVNGLKIELENEGYQVNEFLKIIIRPEQIETFKEKEDGTHKGVIEDIIYMGDYSKLYINVNGLIFKADVNDVDLYSVNDVVYIRFNPSTTVGIKE